jgi:hypothetical protein
MDHPDTDMKRKIFYLLTALALITGVFHAISLTYVNDDCFVSFRYAKNLINGLGLVYNAEERVEGYTNFLWTIIIAFGMKLDIDPVPFSTTVGIVFFSFTLFLYGYLSWKFKETGKHQYIWIPLTALALCLHRDMAAHATSGMETSMFTFLISCTYCLLLTRSSGRSYITAGFIFVLAMMTRPDGILFYFCAVLYLALTRKKFLLPVVMLVLPAIVIFVPYWLWRFSYFGFFFPNTFYAKSINLDYYSQGLTYAWLYLETYLIYFLIIPLGVVGLWKFIKPTFKTNIILTAWRHLRTEATEPHPVLLGTLYITLYTFFVIRIGGDFMFARFFIPITPMIYFLIERLLNRYASQAAFLAVALIVLFGTYFRNDQYKDNVFVGYIADEKQYFTSVEPLEQSQKDAATLKKYFKDLPVRVAFYAGQLRLIYYLDPEFAVESSSGLTDTAIAHQVITTRERPGHEKHPTLDYLIKRRVHFYIGPTDPVPSGQFVLNAISFDSLRARIITYNNRIMSILERDSSVSFIHLSRYLDDYIANIHSYSLQKVAYDYSFLRSFYFQVNDDKLRENAFLRYLHQ